MFHVFNKYRFNFVYDVSFRFFITYLCRTVVNRTTVLKTLIAFRVLPTNKFCNFISSDAFECLQLFVFL